MHLCVFKVNGKGPKCGAVVLLGQSVIAGELSCGSDGKESTCNAGDLGLIPGLERSSGGQGSPLQFSFLEDPHGQRSLAGYSTWCHKESDMTKRLSTTRTCGWSGVCQHPRPLHSGCQEVSQPSATPPHTGQPERSLASPVSPGVAELAAVENRPEGDEDSVTRNTRGLLETCP